MALGPEAKPSLLGKRVIDDPCYRDRTNPASFETTGYIGSERDGGFAQYVALPEENEKATKFDPTEVLAPRALLPIVPTSPKD